MTERQFVDQRQPQTLYISQILLYFSAAAALLFGVDTVFIESLLLEYIVAILLTVGAAAGAYGIANSRKWGYQLGIAAAVAPFIIRFEIARRIDVGSMFEYQPIGLIFDIAILAALLHPMSRNYQRVWFQ